MKQSDILRGRDDDRILKASLLTRLKALQPVGDHDAFEDENIRKLRPRVAAFEQLAGQKIIATYQSGPHSKRGLIDALVKLAELAGEPLRRYFSAPYASGEVISYTPADEARKDIRDILHTGLNTLKTKMPIITDRPQDNIGSALRRTQRWWLISPVDGIDYDDASISIALINDGVPAAGVIHFPRLNRTYAGATDAFAIVKTAHRTRNIHVKLREDFHRVAATARNAHDTKAFEALCRSHRVSRIFADVSAPYALCRLAQGTMDIYLQPGMLPQAPIAAAQAIVTAAGGTMMTHDGKPILYGSPEHKVLALPPFVAGSDKKALHTHYLGRLVA